MEKYLYTIVHWIKKIDLFYLFCSILLLILFYFLSGFFKYQVLAVKSNSMSPSIETGDIVLINQKVNKDNLQVGDIIAYKYDDQIIIHRIKKVIKEKNNRTYLVKGDQNEMYDPIIIKKERIKGKVEKAISNLGKPTIWIYSIFK